MSNVFRFRIPSTSAPPRCEGLAPHQMLCTLFLDGTPIMDFLKDIFQGYGILTVQHWDHRGGTFLFDQFNLDDASRKRFNETVGSPRRPPPSAPAPVRELRPTH